MNHKNIILYNSYVWIVIPIKYSITNNYNIHYLLIINFIFLSLHYYFYIQNNYLHNLYRLSTIFIFFEIIYQNNSFDLIMYLLILLYFIKNYYLNNNLFENIIFKYLSFWIICFYVKHLYLKIFFLYNLLYIINLYIIIEIIKLYESKALHIYIHF